MLTSIWYGIETFTAAGARDAAAAAGMEIWWALP
jgi:hypothetical protein